MFEEIFEAAEEKLSGENKRLVQSNWKRLSSSCADSLPFPQLTREKGYPIGLKNHGPTSLLNSLFQLFFHVPELKNAILHLPLCIDIPEQPTEFVSQDRHRFLLGMQRLFAEMSLSNERAIDAAYLKKAFGWDNSEQIYQYDIQEAMRVIFDMIQRTLSGTPQQELIRNLFKGVNLRYNICKKCGETSQRQEQFYDIQLLVRNYSSVEESIVGMTRAESMDNDNAILCDACGSRQNHWLGTRLNELPHNLVVTLGRFEFDFQKMQRVKITSLFQFQLELDLTPYLPNHQDVDLGYELYGVIFHVGSAQGGHYYCYVRDLMGNYDWADINGKEKQNKDVKVKKHNSKKKEEQAMEEKERFNARKEYLTQGLKNSQLLEGWFEIIDSTVKAVDAEIFARKFEGKDSAYILFYRLKNLALPQLATIPAYFSKSILAANISLQQNKYIYEFEKQNIIFTIDQTCHKLPKTTSLHCFLQTYVPQGVALVLEEVDNGRPYYPCQLINSPKDPYPPEATLSSAGIYHQSRWKTYALTSPEYARIEGYIGKDGDSIREIEGKSYANKNGQDKH